MRANVFCYAKKDLEPGDVIDGMGGYMTYGLIETLAGQGGEGASGGESGGASGG
jgi:predicted homoserine dehydrogenase-like protein